MTRVEKLLWGYELGTIYNPPWPYTFVRTPKSVGVKLGKAWVNMFNSDNAEDFLYYKTIFIEAMNEINELLDWDLDTDWENYIWECRPWELETLKDYKDNLHFLYDSLAYYSELHQKVYS